MCRYVKDDGEQCGMNEEPFCRHHEDTEQAAQWEAAEQSGQFDGVHDIPSDDESGAQSNFVGTPMGTTCEQCETELRRRERLTDHPRMGNRLVFEAYAECDCSEYVFASKSVSMDRLPEGWT